MAELVCKKVRFANEEAALFSLKKIQSISKRRIVPIRAYLCKYCKTWHLTSRPDPFELLKENETLKVENAKLKQEIVDLNKKENKELRVKIRADARVVEQRLFIEDLQRTIKTLRWDKSTLLGKLHGNKDSERT